MKVFLRTSGLGLGMIRVLIEISISLGLKFKGLTGRGGLGYW